MHHLERLLVGCNNVLDAIDFRVTSIQVDWQAVAHSLALRISAKAKDWEGLIVVVRFDYSTVLVHISLASFHNSGAMTICSDHHCFLCSQ